MKTGRIIKSATSVLAAVTFTVSLAVTGPVAAQIPNFIAVVSHPAPPGVSANCLAPDGTSYDPWHAYTPADFCAAYNIDNLHAKGLPGAGTLLSSLKSMAAPPRWRTCRPSAKPSVWPRRT
jgi:hypothetical protein